jgi:hypothetical protein
MDTNSVYNMGRKTVLFGFWIIGYVLGAFAWLVRAPVYAWVESLGVSADVAGALLTGLAGSMMMLVGVMLWSYFSPSSSA